jgi:hypothetical protein
MSAIITMMVIPGKSTNSKRELQTSSFEANALKIRSETPVRGWLGINRAAPRCKYKHHQNYI